MLKKIFFIVSISIVISCGNNQTNKNENTYEEDILGFWNRVGTIQLMNGIAVDTLAFKDSKTPDNKQIKAFLTDRVMWINNFWKDSLAPWKGGAGGYGKFNIYSRDSLTELITHGTGLMGASIKKYKDEENQDFRAWNMSINLGDKVFSQKGGAGAEYAEYWEKLPDLKPKSRIDGVWKRVYEIAYVNNVPVDTTSAPSDIILDVKVMYRGRYMYQVDQTGMFDENELGHGGFGGYGTFELDSDKNILKEKFEWGSGGWNEEDANAANPDRGNYVQSHEITFFNDDLFLQVDNQNAGVLQGSGATGRGLVYKRIK